MLVYTQFTNKIIIMYYMYNYYYTYNNDKYSWTLRHSISAIDHICIYIHNNYIYINVININYVCMQFILKKRLQFQPNLLSVILVGETSSCSSNDCCSYCQDGYSNGREDCKSVIEDEFHFVMSALLWKSERQSSVYHLFD